MFDCGGNLSEPLYSEKQMQQVDKMNKKVDEGPPEEMNEARPRCAGNFWCACGQCEPMDTEEECLCCQESDLFVRDLDAVDTETRCVTAMEDFPSLVNRAVLSTFFYAFKTNWRRRQAPEGPDGRLSNKQCRLIAYRVLLQWALRGKRLGRRVRRVLPSCVVKTIRKMYPSPTGDYQGFSKAEDTD